MSPQERRPQPAGGRSEIRKRLEELQAPAQIEGDAVLDTVGLYCPVPIIKTSERIKELPEGKIIEVISDDRVILVDMPAWCLATGHAYLGSRAGQKEWRLFVRKK